MNNLPFTLHDVDIGQAVPAPVRSSLDVPPTGLNI